MADPLQQPATHAPMPVLAYARPFSAEDPFPQAEAMILADTSMSIKSNRHQFQRMFSSFTHAAAFYAHFQNQRFSRGNLDGICKGCGQPTDGAVMLDWAVRFLPQGSEFFRGELERGRMKMRTYHSLCDPCLRKNRQRRRWRRLISGVLMLLTWCGLCVLCIAWGGEGPAVMAITAVSALAVAALIYKMPDKLWPNSLPPALRQIVCDPFVQIRRDTFAHNIGRMVRWISGR